MTELEFPLSSWESFYVIVGTSAAALTGLMFVVIALVADHDTRAENPQIGAFSSPNVVHFSLALFVSAIVSAPWHSTTGPGCSLGVVGLGGLIYSVIVIRRAIRQKGYKPVLEDWVWHATFPVLAYGALTASAFLLSAHPHEALFWVGGATLLLVFIGIHNAWDTVIYITVDRRKQTADKDK